MADKPPYKLTIKLTSARADAIGEALTHLRAIADSHDQAPEGSATVMIESWKEQPLTAIREAFELWLHRYRIGIECEVTQKAPGLRPETVAALRATGTTPLDDALSRLPRSDTAPSTTEDA